MAAPFTSYGYGGYVASEASWSALAVSLGTEYGVVDAGDWKVTAVPSSDRTISVAVGKGWGKGVYDVSSASVQKTLTTVSAGFRWDLVVLRRDTSGAGGSTSVVVIEGGATTAVAFGLRKAFDTGDGTKDDQPLAVVRVDAGSTNITSIIDVRVWQANAGAVATSELVKSYLAKPGTQVLVGTDLWSRTINVAGTASWQRTALLSPVNMLAAGNGLTGSPPAGASFFMQGGTLVPTTDFAGYARITFPIPFPNGLLTFFLTNGDDAAGNALVFGASGSGVHGASAFGSRQDLVYRLWGPSNGESIVLANRAHRVNWAAWGW